jgi:hypothetical protein
MKSVVSFILGFPRALPLGWYEVAPWGRGRRREE